MGKQDIMRKYWPMMCAHKISPKQYEWLIKQGRSVMHHQEPGKTGQESKGFGRNDQSNDESDAIVEYVLDEFGGHETTHSDAMAGTSQKARLFNLLRDGLWHTTSEIARLVYNKNDGGTCRIASRVQDLKNEGYTVESKQIKGSLWAYRLFKQV